MSLEPIQVPAAGRRRSGRIAKEISIVLSGDDTEGKQFSETTKTLVLSRHGASILSLHKLIPEQVMFLRAVEANKEVEVRICGEIGERADGHIYGAAFVDSFLDFWGIEFPPVEKLEPDLMRMTLECTGCRQRAVAQFDATEMDVYTVNQGVLRYCKRCLISTVWKITTEEIAPEAPAPVAPETGVVAVPQKETKPETLPGAETSVTPPANRRKERRTKVKLNACIRSLGASDEVVACEDMSRGGFSFRTSRQYSEEAMIEVALPYTTGQVAIFVPAQIANVRRLPEGNLYRCGAKYIRSPKKGTTW